MSGTIAVGVAGTEPSRVALRWSMKRAVATGADVRLVNVLDSEFLPVIGARAFGEDAALEITNAVAWWAFWAILAGAVKLHEGLVG